MKILLLGANGQLGSDIIRMHATLKSSHELIALTRKDVDVSELEDIKSKLMHYDFDILINCTSYHNTEQVEANPAGAFQINAFAVREMASVCRGKNAALIHISTDYVFGGPNKHQPLTEEDAPAPLNIYGASKLMGEALASTVCDSTYILRVASLFGIAGASGKGGNFIEAILKKAKETGALKVVSDQRMSPTSTLDIARSIFKIIDKKIPFGIYHMVNTGEASWYEFAKKAIELSGINATVEPIPAAAYPLKAMRPAYSVLSNEKLTREIGAIPSWENALSEYLLEKGYVLA